MEHTFYVLGFLFGIAAVTVIALAIGSAMRKKGEKAAGYDERQEAVRCRAYKAAFMTLVVYQLAYCFFDLCTGVVWCDRVTGAFLGIAVAVAVFGVSSIMNDAYFRSGESQRPVAALFGLASAVDIGLGVWRLIKGEMIVDGMLTHASINLIVGLMFLPMLIAMLVKHGRDKREAETE